MHFQGALPVLYFSPYLPLKGFKAWEIERGVAAAVSYERRDFYKICLVTAKSRINAQGEVTEIDGSVLFFASPHPAYSWESLSPAQNGYSCLFTENFLSRYPGLATFLQSPLCGLRDIAVFPLTQTQNNHMAIIFQQLLFAQDSDYIFKHELIGNCLHLLTHEALKMQPYEKG